MTKVVCILLIIIIIIIIIIIDWNVAKSIILKVLNVNRVEKKIMVYKLKNAYETNEIVSEQSKVERTVL